MMCSGDNVDGAFRPMFEIYKFGSMAQMRSHPTRLDTGLGRAMCHLDDGGVVVFVADVSGPGERDVADRVARERMEPLREFGCEIVEPHLAQQGQSPPQGAPSAPVPPSKPPPAAVTPPSGAAGTAELPVNRLGMRRSGRSRG